MMNAFYVRSMTGYEILPEIEGLPWKLEVFNSTGKGSHFAVRKHGKKVTIILVTEGGAEEINLYGDKKNGGRSDPLD